MADDRLVRVGSSNVDNRSIGFDTECDVAVETSDEAGRKVARGFRSALLAEHLAVDPERIERAQVQEGSLIAAIEMLRAQQETAGRRRLVPIEVEPMNAAERALADEVLFDPDHWPRHRPRPIQAVTHGAERAMAPYHVETVGALTAVLGIGANFWGALARRALARRFRERRQEAHAPPPGFPAVLTSTGRTRPPVSPTRVSNGTAPSLSRDTSQELAGS